MSWSLMSGLFPMYLKYYPYFSFARKLSAIPVVVVIGMVSNTTNGTMMAAKQQTRNVKVSAILSQVARGFVLDVVDLCQMNKR